VDDGGYVATSPALPGVVTEADTVEQTMDRAPDVARGYLESLALDGVAIPVERDPIVNPITVTLQQGYEPSPSGRDRREVIEALDRAIFNVHHSAGGHVLRHASDRAKRVTVPLRPTSRLERCARSSS
jgi:predicted RNase H-like HicB family nuclease